MTLRPRDTVVLACLPTLLAGILVAKDVEQAFKTDAALLDPGGLVDRPLGLVAVPVLMVTAVTGFTVAPALIRRFGERGRTLAAVVAGVGSVAVALCLAAGPGAHSLMLTVLLAAVFAGIVASAPREPGPPEP